VRRHNDSIDLDRHLLEARPLVDRATVSVRGELHIEQGERVLRGTDEVPLLLTDGSFGDYRRWLLRQALRTGVIVAASICLTVSLWFEWYVPFAVLLVGLLIYIGYRFTQDVHIIVDFLRRVFGG
jgi:hypothetical protein